MNLGILGKILIPILCVVTLVSGGGFYFTYYQSRSAIEQLLRGELSAFTQFLGRNVLDFTSTAKLDIFNLTTMTYINAVINGANSDNVHYAGTRLKAFTDQYNYFATVVVADTAGTVLTSSDPKAVGMSIADLPYFKQALQGDSVFSKPTMSKVTGEGVISLAIPIQKGTTISGVIIAAIPLKEFSNRLVSGIKVGETGYPFVVAGNGVIIAHPDPQTMGKVDINELDWGKKVMATDDGFISYDWQGHPKLASVLFIKNLGYRIVFTMDYSEVLSRIQPVINASLMAMLSVLALISLTLFLMIRAFVSRPLGVLSKAADTVANGNLNVDMDSIAPIFANKGEMTIIYSSMRKMLTALKDNIAIAEQKTADAARRSEEAAEATQQAEKARHAAERAKSDGMHTAAEQLEGSVAIISSASEELSAQIEQSERGAGEQAGRVTETATAMEEMNSTVIEVSRSASIAAEMSINTRHKAEEGARIVHDVVESIRDVQRQSVALKSDMGVLATHAQAINQIMGVISDIADQTNLLALNAAIEAARAGDAGRGFAVVADEVRKLAEKTMASTSDVGNAIRSIQESASKNIAQVDTTVQTIETATGLADKSGVVLTEILGMADETADQVRSIATAAEEQSATSEEINRSISQVNTIASETSRAMQEATSAVSELARQAHTLQKLVDAMKTA